MTGKFRYFLLLLCAVVWLGNSALAGEISEVSVVGEGEYTRITLASDTEIRHGIFSLAHNGQRAIAIDFPDARVGTSAVTPAPTGAVTSYEILGGGIAFRLSHAVEVSRALSIGPTTADPRHRLVVDLVRVSPVRFDREAAVDVDRRAAFLSGEGAGPAEAVEMAAAEPASRKRVIVIDPGHGGHDPGASAHDLTREKTIVLATSQALKTKLDATGRYTVHLTRSDDTYIDHEDRVSMARNWGADLFISVHADAAGNSSVSGATVYTLSARGERRVDGTASANGWQLPVEDSTSQEIVGILTDLTKRETKTNSSIFAEMLIPELAGAGPIVRNSHRRENFFVLLAPDVPAVLVEIGFLTNRADVARLSSQQGRDRTAAAIANAIDTYFAQAAGHTAVN